MFNYCKMHSVDEFQVKNVFLLENHNLTFDSHQPTRVENNLCFHNSPRSNWISFINLRDQFSLKCHKKWKILLNQYAEGLECCCKSQRLFARSSWSLQKWIKIEQLSILQPNRDLFCLKWSEHVFRFNLLKHINCVKCVDN